MGDDRSGLDRVDAAAPTDQSMRLPPPLMTPDAVRLYRAVVTHPEWSTREAQAELNLDRLRFGQALEALTARRLLRPALDGGPSVDPVAPESAAVDLLTDEENRLRHQQALLARVRDEILGLQQTYLRALRDRGAVAALDVVGGDGDTVGRLLDRYAEQVAGVVRVMYPGPSLDGFPWLVRWASGASPPGPVTGGQLLLDTSLRCHRAGRLQLESLSGNGHAVRTGHLVPLGIVLFGAELAVLPAGPEQSGPDVVVVRHPAVLTPLGCAFDRLWAAARPLPAAPPGPDAEPRGELRAEILQLLAAGHKDELIARKVGMSVRTCRRHIAEIMEQLGATSRFQAGALAERLSLRDDAAQR